MGTPVRFGAFADPLHKQLEVPEEALKTEQKISDGLTMCILHGIVTDAEGHKARKRLAKMITKTLKDKGLYE